MKCGVILESYDFGELCSNHAHTTPTFPNDHTQFLNSLSNMRELIMFDVNSLSLTFFSSLSFNISR
jgi:hypothetical protein